MSSVEVVVAEVGFALASPLLLYSGLAKALTFKASVKRISRSLGLRISEGKAVIAFLSCIECAAGLALLALPGRLSYFCASALLLAFGIMELVLMMRGDAGTPCACFGTLSQARLSAGSVLRDWLVGLMLAFSLWPRNFAAITGVTRVTLLDAGGFLWFLVLLRQIQSPTLSKE